MPNDYLFRGDLAELDPEVAELVRHETARQARYLIMIPSESTVPAAVREALGSAFHNLYAEGYPLDETRTMTQAEILDYNARLPEYRRYADKRYYKGTEYADIVEALARRRVAELFAPPGLSPDKLFVNVQPLSGAPANSAVFTALLNVGDTIMGLDLLQGGHLTHGSPINRSGKYYKAVGYTVDPVTEKLDYDQIRALAREHRPKLIIAGFTSYPYTPDWHAFRSIADEVGAYMLTDVSHVSGMIIGDVYPNPVGIADVVMFTTHKTLGGPRGAVLITHRGDLSSKIDRAVFPGEQGGPHVNAIAALAVSLRLAYTDQFRALQKQTVVNAARLAQKFQEHGLRVAYGGTDTHMVLIDCKSVVGADGTTLSGDAAARILDLAGIVANRNTVPGDPSALRASGVRFGTPWITQRGFHEPEIDRLAEIIADLIKACVPFSYTGKKRAESRAKVDFDTLQRAKNAVRDLAASVGIDTDVVADDYPHFYYMDGDKPGAGWQTLAIKGEPAAAFLHTALTSDVYALGVGEQQPTRILEADGAVMARGVVERTADGYRLHVESNASRVASWLRGLSDGFTLFDPADPYAKVSGAVDVQTLGAADASKLSGDWKDDAAAYARHKAYSIGMSGAKFAGHKGDPLPEFAWTEPSGAAIKTTPLHSTHKELGAKMTEFAGYDMPVWYSSVTEEHAAVRKSAGIFDVTHMGVFELSGTGALPFLQALTTNNVEALPVGDSQYGYLLDVNGIPLDDLMIYRTGEETYMMVVNASNNDKNWAWLNAVKERRVRIDNALPWRTVDGVERLTLRDLRDPAAGADRRVDIALQGKASKDILLSLGGSDADKAKVKGLPWAGVTHVSLGGFDLIVSRTGYTGERTAYELFVHPDQAAALFKALIAGGAAPCGLAARDSLRTEAGLPLYGHELAGALNLNPADAGFGTYVALWKPFFVGKMAFIAHEQARDAEIMRFRLANKGARPPHQGDPLIDARGRVIGIVTSASLDSDGYQLGQAYLNRDDAAEGAQVAVFCGSARSDKGVKGVGLGDKVAVPEPAVILSRFPKKGS